LHRDKVWCSDSIHLYVAHERCVGHVRKPRARAGGETKVGLLARGHPALVVIDLNRPRIVDTKTLIRVAVIIGPSEKIVRHAALDTSELTITIILFSQVLTAHESPMAAQTNLSCDGTRSSSEN
jgi:hypothetical protein